MSKKMNAKRAAYAKKQEENGKRVVKLLFWSLLAFALIFICMAIFFAP